MGRVLPVVTELASRFPDRTVFNRFMTPERPEDMPGGWQRYNGNWRNATREHVDPGMLDLVPPLALLAPPVVVIDKTRYSAIFGSSLLSHLRNRSADEPRRRPPTRQLEFVAVMIVDFAFAPKPRLIDGPGWTSAK